MRLPSALAILATLLLAAAAATPRALAVNEAPRVPLDRANVLPLALDEHFQFRKVEQFLNDPRVFKPTSEPMIQFERTRVNWKAITAADRLARRGHYFTFFWRTTQSPQTGPVTVRFEYRQENLGAYVQAREVSYTKARGTITTKFEVIGDDYLDDGRITAWRALLVQGGKIVGLTQSYLWE